MEVDVRKDRCMRC